jgi:2-polyprenyl-3-methyl-5-hydroxy-6-metoxy-1,4-benzoquinol methylase
MILQKIVESIAEKNIRHSKSLSKYITSWDESYRNTVGIFLEGYCKFLEYMGIDLDFAVDAYLFLVEEVVAHQLEFERTGCYKYKTFQEVNQHVYADSAYMKKYMIGLAISQFFWENHHEIFKFFVEALLKHKRGNSYLEIGPGHGMFLQEALKNTEYQNFTALDVSSESLNQTRKMMQYVRPDLYDKISFLQGNIDSQAIGQSYDFITMGEVLEHLESPEHVLMKLNKSLSDEGRFFISTCANSPAVDHIYLFTTIDEIRAMFDRCGFWVETEAALPINNYSLEKAQAKKATINYCALLRKK